MKSTIQYLLSVFSNEIIIEVTSTAEYPLYFQKKYDCQFFSLNGKSYVLVEHSEKTQLVIEVLKKELQQIKKLTNRFPLFVFSGIRLSQRNTLIQNKIPFIVPKTQVYIPNVLINLTERELPEHQYGDKFIKSTQVAFAFLLLNPMDEINGQKLAAELGYSPNTASRILNELVERGIMYREGNGTRKKFFMPDKRTYWERGKKYLFNPVTNAFLLAKNKVNFESGLLYKSYDTALYSLSDHFDEDSVQIPSYACFVKRVGEATNDCIPVLSEMSFKDLVSIQCLAYDPAMLTNTDIIDIVTLYAQLAEKNDERIQIALDELMEEVLDG